MAPKDIQKYKIIFFSRKDLNSFKRIYNTLPAIDPHISAGVASGDIDNDGDLDIYVCNWGGKFEREPNDYYLNQGTSNQWIKFRLKGIKSNTYGIGSWAILTLDDNSVMTRYFIRETGYGSENAPEIHFGIPESKKSQKFNYTMAVRLKSIHNQTQCK